MENLTASERNAVRQIQIAAKEVLEGNRSIVNFRQFIETSIPQLRDATAARLLNEGNE